MVLSNKQTTCFNCCTDGEPQSSSMRYLSDSGATALETFVYTTIALELRLFAQIVMGHNLPTAQRCCYSHSLDSPLSYSGNLATSVEGLFNTPLGRCVRRICASLSIHIPGSRWRAWKAPPSTIPWSPYSSNVEFSLAAAIPFFSPPQHP